MIYHYQAEKTDAGLSFDIQLDKEKSVYCFIGENGSGKTNLLENIAKTFLFYHAMFRDYQERFADRYSKDYFERYKNRDIFESIKAFRFSLPAAVQANDFEIKKKNDFSGSITLQEIVERDTVPLSEKDEQEFEEKINTRTGGNMYLWPLFGLIDQPLVFIGAKERGFTRNLDTNNVRILGNASDRFLEAFTRSFRYMTGDAITDTAVADWFNSRLIINPAYVPQHQNRVFEVIAVLELMQRLEPGLKNLLIRDNGNIRPNILFSEGKLYFHDIPLDKLSTGFISIIKIFQEIIAGYGGWTGLSGEISLRTVEGIVFIDEIESHLHPRWQNRIIPILKGFFPKTIFYIATHSPVVVSSTGPGEAYELVRKENDVTAKRLGNPAEWYLVDVFEQGFHVDLDHAPATFGRAASRKPDLADQLKRFSELVKAYTIRQDDLLKEEIDNLYEDILPSLPEGDPRRRSLDSLKGLVP